MTAMIIEASFTPQSFSDISLPPHPDDYPIQANLTMTKAGTGPPTALVVDDFPDSRRVLRRMLELRGYRVAEASGGEESVEAARRECADLILMDLNMPGTDGLEAARRIRRLKECEGAVLVAFTAFDAAGMSQEAAEAGFDAYLVKPFGFDELDGVLRRHLPSW
jgi:two-component system cell cycle response regulator DivK